MSLHAAAEGCFTPFIAIYFRQLGLSSSKIGFLLGVRILTGTFFCLFWRHFARKFNKLKVLLVCSVFAAILFRVALSFIPPVSSEFLLEYCADSNHSSSQAKQNHSTTSFDNPPIARSGSLDAEFLSRSLHHPEMSNVKLLSQRRNDDNIDSKTNDSISSSSSSIFFITFIVVLFGEMFASSSVHMVRASLYHHLDDTDNLSFFPVAVTICSLSYGISAVAVSGAIDQIPCIIFENKSSMVVQFASSAFFLLLATALSIFLPIFQSRSLLNSANRVVQAGRFLLSDLHHIFLALSCFVLGLLLSLGKGFLFWHLQDLGGTEFSMGFYLFMESISHSVVRFNSHWCIPKIGLFGVFGISFICLSLTYLFLGMISNSWMALLITPIAGFTHTLFWRAISSFLERTAPPGLFHPLFIHSESFSALGAVLGYMTSGLLGRIIRFKIVFVVFGIFAASWGAVSLVMMHYFPKKETIQYAQLFRSEGDSGDDDSTSEDWLEKALDEDEEF